MRMCTSRRVAAFRTRSVGHIDSARILVEHLHLVAARVLVLIILAVEVHMHQAVAGVVALEDIVVVDVNIAG